MTDLVLINLRHMWTPLYALEVPLNALLLLFWNFTGRVKFKNSIYVVHGAANLAPLIAARFLRLSIVWHFHETTPIFCRFVSVGMRILRNTRHKIAVVAKKSIEVYKLEEAEFLPAPIDTDFWCVKAVSEQEQESCEWMDMTGGVAPLRVLAVGNLNPLKGMDILIEAMKAIDGPWHLKIVGSSLKTQQVYADALHESAEINNSKNQEMRIELLGWQDKRQVRALMSTCDLFVLPSRSEACPLVLLEAMSIGCRVVAADVGDVAAMMATYPNKRIFQAENVQDCSSAIDTIKYEATRNSKVDSTWQLRNVADKTEQFYRQFFHRG